MAYQGISLGILGTVSLTFKSSLHLGLLVGSSEGLRHRDLLQITLVGLNRITGVLVKQRQRETSLTTKEKVQDLDIGMEARVPVIPKLEKTV